MAWTADEVKSELDLASESLSESIRMLTETVSRLAGRIRSLETRLAAYERPATNDPAHMREVAG